MGSAQETVLDTSPGSSCTSNDWGQSLTRGISLSGKFKNHEVNDLDLFIYLFYFTSTVKIIGP
jgi:hypothetical protein